MPESFCVVHNSSYKFLHSSMFGKGNKIWNSLQDIGPCINRALSFTLQVVMAPFFCSRDMRYPSWWLQMHLCCPSFLNGEGKGESSRKQTWISLVFSEQRRYLYSQQGNFYEIWSQPLRCWTSPLCFVTALLKSQNRKVTKVTHAHGLKSTPWGIADIILSLL